jgi:hypothetical protein
MPNWCNNTIILNHTDPNMIDRVIKSAYDGFLREFYPCPKKILKTPTGVTCKRKLIKSTEHHSVLELLRKTAIKTPKRTSSTYKRKQRRLERIWKNNIQTYGYKDWYDWNIANWGTKWDVYADTDSVKLTDTGGITFTFDSAWSPPIGAYIKLQELGFDVICYYFEPNMSYAGIWKNGNDECYSDFTEIPKELDEMYHITEITNWLEEMERKYKEENNE